VAIVNVKTLQGTRAPPLILEHRSRVAVIGGGPAGSFFAYFLIRLARLIDLELEVEVFEPRYFTHRGPAGCNHCGGIISESLVQVLATEGINLPAGVVQRGIDSYRLHMDVGDVRIETPLHERRIAAVYRGNGPRSSEPLELVGFDRFMQELCRDHGACILRELVTKVEVTRSGARIECANGTVRDYDLVAFAAGINTGLSEGIKHSGPQRRGPKALTTFICEFRFGEEVVERYFGGSMHVFLLDLPRLEFAALIPKGEFVTMCMLGQDVDSKLVQDFLNSAEVRRCFPDSIVPRNICHCFPRINVEPHAQPFGDRFVMVGDCGVTRLYKDGIGSAYRTAKAAATTAVLHGIASEDFRRFFAPTCRAINRDNQIGKMIFAGSHLFQKMRLTRRAILRMTALEQQEDATRRHMSSILWDVFSGSAPYREILTRAFHPGFIAGLLGNLVMANVPFGRVPRLDGVRQ
jgi:flavin-dependent dehydrogenase